MTTFGTPSTCSICGATHRNRATHQEGMTKDEHERGAIDYTRPHLNTSQYKQHNLHREMKAMDEAVVELSQEAVRASVADAKEDEAATMTPPTEDSDPVVAEMLGARLEYEKGELHVVFKVGTEYFFGMLRKYIPKPFDPLDLIREGATE